MLIKPSPVNSNATVSLPTRWALIDWPHSWFLIREHHHSHAGRTYLWYRWTIYVDFGTRELWDERYVRHELW